MLYRAKKYNENYHKTRKAFLISYIINALMLFILTGCFKIWRLLKSIYIFKRKKITTYTWKKRKNKISCDWFNKNNLISRESWIFIGSDIEILFYTKITCHTIHLVVLKDEHIWANKFFFVGKIDHFTWYVKNLKKI